MKKIKKIIFVASVRVFLTFVLVFSLSCAISMLNAAEKTSDARRIWLQGFEIYEKAERNEKIGKYDEALKGYEEAIVLFKKVQEGYPDWNSFLIDYRIKKCLQQIDAIKPLSKKTQQRPATQATTTTIQETQRATQDTRNMEIQIRTLQRDLQDLRLKHETAINALAEVKKEAARGVAATEEIRRLNQEKNELEKRYAIVSDELKKALEKPSAQDIGQEKEKLQKEVLEFASKSIEAEKKMKDISNISEILKRENQELKLSKAEHDYKIKEYDIALKNAEKRLTDAETNANELGLKLSAAEEKSSKLNSDIEKKLKNIDELKAENQNLNKKLSELLEKNEAGALAQQLQNEKKKLSEELQSLVNEMDGIKKENEKLAQNNSDLSTKNQKYQKIIVDNSNKLSGYSSDIAALKAKTDEYKNTIDLQANDIAKMATERAEQRAMIEQLTQKLTSMSSKDSNYTELTRHATEIDAKNRQLLEKIKSTEDDIRAYNDKFTQLKNENEDLKKKLALHEDEKTKDAQKLTENENMLKNAKDLAVALEQSKVDIERLKESNAILQKEIESKRSQEIAAVGINEIRQENEKLIRVNAEISAKNEKNEKNLEELKAKLEEINKKNDKSIELAKIANEETNKNTQLKEELKNSVEEKKNLSNKIDSLNNELNELKKKLSTSETTNASEKQKNDELLAENENIREKAKQMASTLEIANAEIEKLKKQNQIFKEEIESKKIEETSNAKIKESNKELTSKVEELQKEIAKIAKDRDKALQKVDQISKDYESTKTDNELNLKNYKIAKKEINEISNENQRLNKNINKLNGEIEKLRKTSPETAKFSDMKNELEEKSKNIKSLTDELEKVKKHNDALRTRLEENIAENVYPKAFREEKEKLMTEIREKNRVIEELKREKESAEAKKPGKTAIEKTTKAKEPAKPKEKPENEKTALLIYAAEDAEKSRDIESAIWHYQKVFEFDKDNQTAAASLARICTDKGDKEKAEAYLKSLSIQKADSPEVSLSVAKTIIKLHPEDIKTAKAWYDKALELGAENDSELDKKLKQ